MGLFARLNMHIKRAYMRKPRHVVSGIMDMIGEMNEKREDP